MKIGDVIRELREQQNLSQERLADRAKCSQQTIGKIENNKTRKPANLPNIAKALGTTAEGILAQVTEDIAATARSGKRATKTKRKSRARWPFDGIKFELFDQLTPPQQLTIESLLFSKINEFRSHGSFTTRKSVRSRKAPRDTAPRESEELHRRAGRSPANED